TKSCEKSSKNITLSPGTKSYLLYTWRLSETLLLFGTSSELFLFLDEDDPLGVDWLFGFSLPVDFSLGSKMESIALFVSLSVFCSNFLSTVRSAFFCNFLRICAFALGIPIPKIINIEIICEDVNRFFIVIM